MVGRWREVVPSKRTELARDKRGGELGEELAALRAEDRAASGSVLQGDKRLERWLLRDWLSEDNARKAAALPFLPKVGFIRGRKAGATAAD